MLKTFALGAAYGVGELHLVLPFVM
jgi:hypothetical protein